MPRLRTAAENKAARAAAKATRKAAARDRRAQLWQAFQIQRKEDRRLLPYMVGAFMLITGVSVGLGVAAGVAGTGHFDGVRRVIVRPGVILVGEGAATRVKPLLAQEKKRTARLVGEVPIYDVMVGTGDGAVPLSKLERFLTKLPANITGKQMDSLESRLTALVSRTGASTMPKGPLPDR